MLFTSGRGFTFKKALGQWLEEAIEEKVKR